MKKSITLLVLICTMAFLFACNEQGGKRVVVVRHVADTTNKSNDNNLNNPLHAIHRVGLALGGGGAKAAAEIGVLKVIDSLGVKVRYISGSSMGSVVGGLYAAGYTAKEIENIWYDDEWLKLLYNSAVESEDSRSFYGLLRGDEFEDHLRWLLNQKGCVSFTDAQIPFRCTASNIVDNNTLEPVVLEEGDMARAIRSSLTFPFPILGYAPVEHKGMKLVDGGMFNNFPVDVVKEMGADKIIGVDLETKQQNNREDNFLKRLLKLGWLINWLKDRPDIRNHNRNRTATDIYVHPVLLNYSIFDFKVRKAREMVYRGEAEMKKKIGELNKLR